MSQDVSYFVQSHILGKCNRFNKQSKPKLLAQPLMAWRRKQWAKVFGVASEQTAV